MIVGPTKTLFMDEISTGLDSSTTYQIVKCLQQIVHLGEATILMSLLQPAPETFELFDDIILLSEGQIVYQGPREYVLDFFESCGFRCPERKGTADFLQEVNNCSDICMIYLLPWTRSLSAFTDRLVWQLDFVTAPIWFHGKVVSKLAYIALFKRISCTPSPPLGREICRCFPPENSEVSLPVPRK